MQVIDQLDFEADRFNIEIDYDQLNKLAAYIELISKWGSKINLTSDYSYQKLIENHFADAFAVRYLMRKHYAEKYCVADIGSGAGLPGIQLAIMFPKWQFDLVELNKKKATFLKTAVHELELRSNCKVKHQDAKELREKAYDLALSRALWKPEKWLKNSMVMIKQEGLVITFEVDKKKHKINGLEFIDSFTYMLRNKAKRFLGLYSAAK